MSAARDATIVAGLRRRLANADAVTLTNFAWFAARRGSTGAALEAAGQALLLRDPPSAARRAIERLSAGRHDGLLLVETSVHSDFPTAHRATDFPSEARDLDARRLTDFPSGARDLNASTSPDLLTEGRRLLAAGQLLPALAILNQFLARHPQHAAGLFHRGVVLAKMRRYAEALRDWESVSHNDLDGRLGVMSRRHARSARELAALFNSR